MAFAEVGVELEFSGSSDKERGVIKTSSDSVNLPVGKEVVCIDPHYYRPTEVDLLIGDPTKANTQLGWKPKYTLSEMVKEMVASDLQICRKNKILKEAGFEIIPQNE
jgi:GDPmannose 4,6-dehydratase